MASTQINFKNIPVQAGIISKIISLDIDSNNCFQELDDAISSDQGVASLVLRVVNSPFYNRGNKVTTIPFAISLLGYSVVRSLALLAFSRSLFSQLIPKGREAEYFSLYEVSDKGTSWISPLFFGLALELTGNYRLAIFSLIIFFISGLVVLLRVNVQKGISEAGNA